MVLDLSKLTNNIAIPEAEKQAFKAVSGDSYTAEPEQAAAVPLPEQDNTEAIKKLQVKANLEKREQATYQQICGKYQENTRKAGQAKADILKGLQAGEDIHTLFLQACECISAMTGEDVFKEQAAEYIKKVYGFAFLQKKPLEMELQEVKDRVLKICAAIDRETNADTVSTLQSVLWGHIQRRDYLQALIDQT